METYLTISEIEALKEAEDFHETKINHKLSKPNKFGNFNRYTDSKGGQAYDDKKIIDHLNGFEFKINK